MNSHDTETSPDWLRERLKRHLSEVLRLSWPVIVARSGLMTMAMADTIMVSHFATTELAYLSIGLVPFIPVFLILLGMVMGTVVLTSAAFGAERYSDCGAVWRRSLPYAVVLGLFGCFISLFGEEILLAGGQTPELAANGGRVMLILGLGLPAYLVTITSSLFLEGIKRPKPAMVSILIANIVNIGLNWMLVYGHLGFSPLGAEGSAISTTVVRWVSTIAIVAYIWFMADHRQFGVRLSPVGGWRIWARQRHIGYSSAFSIGGESLSFAAMGLFAGWLGQTSLAAYSIANNLIAMSFMISLGVGSATVVRVSIARGREDWADLHLAGWIGLAVNTVFMGGVALLFGFGAEMLAHAYSSDEAVVAEAIPLIAFCGIVVLCDGGQSVMVNALRGAGGIWSPALIQNIAFIAFMLPFGWWLGIHKGGGAIGLYQAIFAATVLSLILLSIRFNMASKKRHS